MIDDIKPLVNNQGLGSGDTIWLEDNELDLWEACYDSWCRYSADLEDIMALESRGVTVYHDPVEVTLIIGGMCPIDLEVTDPDGLVINNSSNSIPDAQYIEQDIDGDGELDDFVIIPYPKQGDYDIQVIPEPEANPGDTFTLTITAKGTTIIIAEETQVSDIPSEPYTVESTDEGGVHISPVAVPNGPHIGMINTPLSFEGSGSYDPDGTVLSYEWDFDNDGVYDLYSTDPTATHIYESTGIYTVKLTVTDNHGDQHSNVFQYTAVYDPEGGFVTGGGWILSPEDAYTADPTLTGKANFGFVSKYQHGATVPTGETEFQFHVADLNFHSTEYNWLVIAGAKAKFKGSGTINGDGDFGFMLSAVDGDYNNKDNPDTFRIKIWDKDNRDIVVYDNQLEDAEDADATMEIGGGSIVVHSE